MNGPATALQPVPQVAGPLVRLLSLVSSGVRESRDQIPAYQRHWNRVARSALAGPEPLYVALGDSLAQGIGASTPEASYVAQLAEHLAAIGRPHGVVNLSRSGARIADVVAEQLPLLHGLPRPPTVVTCTIGSNDLLRSLLLHRTIADMRRLVALLPPGSVVATVPDVGSLAAGRFNKSVRNHVGRATHCDLADVARELGRWRLSTARDRFHPDDRGYGAWTTAFIAALERLVSSRDETAGAVRLV